MNRPLICYLKFKHCIEMMEKIAELNAVSGDFIFLVGARGNCKHQRSIELLEEALSKCLILRTK